MATYAIFLKEHIVLNVTELIQKEDVERGVDAWYIKGKYRVYGKDGFMPYNIQSLGVDRACVLSGEYTLYYNKGDNDEEFEAISDFIITGEIKDMYPCLANYEESKGYNPTLYKNK